MLSRLMFRSSRLLSSRMTVASFSSSSSSSSSASSKDWVPGIGKGKTTTGLTGLLVDHDAIPKMITKYQALLDKMAASDMPETAMYRSTMEALCRYRIQACLDHPDDPEKVEELCNCGQVEELVQQADNEMLVLDMYLKGRYWEQIVDVDTDMNPDPNKDIYGDEEEGAEGGVKPGAGDAKQEN